MKEPYLISDCCGADVLYQQHKGNYSQWEFCANCLKPFEPITEETYGKTFRDTIQTITGMQMFKTGFGLYAAEKGISSNNKKEEE